MLRFENGTAITESALIRDAVVLADGETIRFVGPRVEAPATPGADVIDLNHQFLSPGFIDLHVHGGAGADFMDGTTEAWNTICRAHARHGTTSFTPTTTVARHDQHMRFLELCRQFKKSSPGTRVLGAHLYGPYFAPEAKSCHPGAHVRPPAADDYQAYFKFADSICTATVAPELEGAEEFAHACQARGIRCNAGHSYATFEQMEAAVCWGVRHVDHLFCAMSDRARLRQSQTYPMRGGVIEATLFFDKLTTEVIADDRHLTPDLLRLAFKVKGPDKLALVTDTNRAMDMPDGNYIFGPLDGGEMVWKRDGVGLMPDGKALASSVVGLDHCVRTFSKSVPEANLPEVIRMASLTPARILGLNQELGSIDAGKRADLVVLDADLNVREIYIGGRRM